MIILDENFHGTQLLQLRCWRIHACQIGHDVGRKGMPDEEIIPLLRTMSKPTFISCDSDFYDKRLSNDRLCLAYLDVRQLEVAAYSRRFLRHPDFKTWSQRKGRVVRVMPSGILSWRVGSPQLSRHRWRDKR